LPPASVAIDLRAATPNDAPAVADVLLASRRAFLPWAPIAHPDDDVHRWVRDELIPSGGVTVACVDDTADARTIGTTSAAFGGS
jgi:hypothetical protein